MAKELKFVMLLDCYGDLLTEHQRNIMELYYCEDLSLAEIGEKQKLYIHSEREHASFPLSFQKGEKIDFTTYFNGFSIGKWERFTTLESVTLDLELEGTFEITYFRWGREGCSELGNERISGPHHSHCFSLGAAPQDIYGFALRSLSSPALLKGGAWKGDFAEWENRKLGVSITTFKREDYVKRNIQVIRSFQKQHPWLVLQVVDNGSTLQEMEQQEPEQQETVQREMEQREMAQQETHRRQQL